MRFLYHSVLLSEIKINHEIYNSLICYLFSPFMKNKKYLHLDIFLLSILYILSDKANNHIEDWTYIFLLIPYANCQNMFIILNEAIGRKQCFEIPSVFCEKKIRFWSKFKRLAVRRYWWVFKLRNRWEWDRTHNLHH